MTPEDLIGIVDVGPPALSADGRYLAFETRQSDLDHNATIIRWKLIDFKDGNRVVDLGVGGEPIIEVFRGQVTGFSIPQRAQWSPDSQWIAYRQKRESRIQVWRSHREANLQQPLTPPEADVDSFAWSADGTKLIFSKSSAKSEFQARLREEGARGYLYDERFSPFHSRAPLFDPDPHHPRSFHVTELVTGIERSATPDEVKELKAQEQQRGQENTELLEDLRRDSSVGVNQPKTVRGCRVSECTGYFNGVWPGDDGRTVYFLRWLNARQSGALALYQWRVGSQVVKEILRTGDLIVDCAQWRSTLMCGHESAIHPRKLIAIDLPTGQIRVIFDPNTRFEDLRCGSVMSLTWQDDRGVEGFGHLVFPIGYESGRRYPLIVVQYRSRGFLRGGTGDEYPIHVFSSRGFAVLSFDRPEDPALEASVRSYEELEEKGWVELRDRRRVLSVLLAGIDHLDRTGIIDPNRVGITGLSDGGETVEFALATQSKRFATAAVSWIPYSPTSYYVIGPKFQRLFARWGFGYPRGAAAEQWKGVSLALNPQQLETPLLVQISDQELLPATEAIAALQEFRKPVELHVFPGEAHVKMKPLHRYHIYRRNLQWFQFWLQNLESSDPVDEGQYERWRALRALTQTSAATQANSPMSWPGRSGCGCSGEK